MSTNAEADSAGAITLRPGEHLVRSERFLEALVEHARAIGAQRGATMHLRRRLREAARENRIPCVRTGNLTAYRLSDVPRVGAILGFHPENYEVS